jgi:integrase
MARRQRDRLTVAAVKAKTNPKKPDPGMHPDGFGLYLAVAGSGAASWVYRYKIDKRPHEMGLGSVDDITLAMARDRRDEARRKILDGVDPIEDKRARRRAAKVKAATAMTFADAAKAYIAAHSAGWKNDKHAAQWPSTLEAYAYPHFGALPVAAVDVGLVMKAIEAIWTTKPETAGRVRGRIESVLDWATARGYRQGANPARWRGHLENLLPKRSKVARVVHHPALPYPEIADFVAALRKQEGVAARALEFSILTAARTGEVIGARWDEINLDEKLWTVPAERMKAGREHRVPLSDAALAIIKKMAARRQGDYVFSGDKTGRSISNMAMLMTLRRMKRSDLTAHGFRSTFSDWCAEKTNFPSEVREMALAHSVGDKVEAAYRRGDLFAKRRQLAEAWAKYCTAPAPGAANVVKLRA